MKQFLEKRIIKSTSYLWDKLKKYLLSTCLFLSTSFSLNSSALTHIKTFQQPNRIGIMGDELSQGKNAHPDLTFSKITPWSLLTGKGLLDIGKFWATHEKNQALSGPSAPQNPKSTWPSHKSFENPLSWVLRNLLTAFARITINSPRLSWSYLTAFKLGVSPNNLTIAAQNQASVDELANQYDQILEENGTNYVDTYFIALAGADLCQRDPSFLPTSQTFEKKLSRLLNYMIKRDALLQQKSRSLQIIVLNYIGITQLLTSEEIKNKKMPLSTGLKTTTCRAWLNGEQSLHESSSESSQEKLVKTFFPPNPKLTCPTLFSLKSFSERETSIFSFFNKKSKQQEIEAHKEEQVTYLANLVRNYREKMASVISNLQTEASKQKVNLFFLDQVGDITFKPKHITNCSRINYYGQVKIAETVLSSLKNKVK